MEENRFIQVMLMRLSSKVLVLEERLETIINSDLDIECKIKKTEKLLAKLSIAEDKHSKFISLLQKDEINK
jgi:hypothetical protein|tara:strand:- start:23145 stop:23357 length:213 start_codon:yes stop_codon:yes gene_type:complete